MNRLAMPLKYPIHKCCYFTAKEEGQEKRRGA
jgi:hypothetical protein